MDDWASYPREELLVQLGFVAPSRMRKPKPEPTLRMAKEPQPESEESKAPVDYYGRPLPDLSALPPARGVGRPNQVAKDAARKAYEQQQAAKSAGREPKDNPGRAVPRRKPTSYRALHQTQDAE